MWGSSGSAPPKGGSVSAWVLAGLFLLVAALIFFGIYLVVPGQHHFWALITIGIVSLVFGLFSYVARALSRQGSIQQGFAWGFVAFGLAVMFLSVVAFPVLYPNSSPLSQLGEVVALILLIVVVIVVVVATRWRSRGEQSVEHREEARAAWRGQSPPSAFSYATAQVPGEAAPTETPGTPPTGGA
jgi:phosphatidylglycerophosphate synthase